MSFIVTIVTILLLIKPEDIPLIIKKIQKIKFYFLNLKNQITLFDLDQNDLSRQEIEQLNFYLQKVIDLDGQYNLNYNLEDIKAKYDLLKAKHLK